jgi:low affinity Fe/Cu permease
VQGASLRPRNFQVPFAFALGDGNFGGNQMRANKRNQSDDKPDREVSGAGKLFSEVANRTSQAAGRALTFMIAAGIVIVWGITGPIFHYSDTWQLVINTGTTIVTFLMVFLIQSTQSRDTQALHLKLDELIRVDNAARNSLLNLEEMSEAESGAPWRPVWNPGQRCRPLGPFPG